MSEPPEETTFKVDFRPTEVTGQLVLRIGTQSISIPAFRSDDNDFDKMTELRSIDFDFPSGEITLRYRPMEEKL